MPSLQSVRRKIDSVKKTQKITKAMKMVAAAKLKRTQDRILAARPYAHKMRDTIRALSRRVNRDAHPLLKMREEHRLVVAVVTSDRGLCGAFNANILRTAAAALKEFESKGMQIEVAVIGRKGRDFFRRRHWKVRREVVDIFDKLSFEHGMLLGTELQAIDDYRFATRSASRSIGWSRSGTSKKLNTRRNRCPAAICTNRMKAPCCGSCSTAISTSKRIECYWNPRPRNRAPA